MATIEMINGKSTPVTVMNGYETMGVWVTAQEVVSDNLIGQYEVYLPSWDGVSLVHSIDAEYRAIVADTTGGRFVSLHAKRQLMAFRK